MNRAIILALLLSLLSFFQSCKKKSEDEKYNEEILKELQKLNYINDSVYRQSFLDSLNKETEKLDSMKMRADSMKSRIDSMMKKLK